MTLIGHLSPAQVYAALTYYHANREEIEADIAAEEVEAERLEREGSLPQCFMTIRLLLFVADIRDQQIRIPKAEIGFALSPLRLALSVW